MTGSATDLPLRYPASWGGLNVSLCHDWLTGMRGGERVLEVLGNGFPGAPIHTLVHKPDAVSATINAHAVRTSWLQHIPGIAAHYRLWLPLFPAAMRGFAPVGGDLLISTSHCVAKGLRTRPGARHLCYCFTPMRYAWTFREEYFGGSRIKQAAAAPVLAALRRWDRSVADRVDHFVAISRHVQDRIRRYYDREADVVYPPIDTARCRPLGRPPAGDFDLIVSALVPYKRIDLAVRAYTRLGRSLKIVGVGSESKRLRALAGPSIEFLGWQPDETVLELYRRCRLLVFPGEEDFGIVPLEAQACGRPVVAFGRGGALETVLDGVSGVFFEDQTETALIEAVTRADDVRWDAAAIRDHAELFGNQRFISQMAACIEHCLAEA